MLNELLEYEEYTCENVGEEIGVNNCRFNTYIYTKRNRGGLARALTIIARKELSDRGYFDAPVGRQKEIIENVRKALAEWLGFDEPEDEKVSDYDGWLRKYYTRVILPSSDKDKSSIRSWEEIRDYKKDEYCGDILEELYSIDNKKRKSKNTFNKITYERIISDAIFLGPLQQYYLICKESTFKNVTWGGETLNNSEDNVKRKHNILKLAAAYLIKKRYTGNEYNVVNQSDLGNWTDNTKIAKGEYYFEKKNNRIKKLMYKKHAFYLKESYLSNVSKIRISEAFIKDNGVRVVTPDELKKMMDNEELKGFKCYMDQGYGKLLKVVDI